MSSCAHADALSTLPTKFLPISEIVLFFCWILTVCLCNQANLISLSYRQADPSQTLESRTLVTFPDFGSRVFFFLCLVSPSQNGERAGPLAKMLLGAKQRGRPRIVSRIIVEEYFAL